MNSRVSRFPGLDISSAEIIIYFPVKSAEAVLSNSTVRFEISKIIAV